MRLLDTPTPGLPPLPAPGPTASLPPPAPASAPWEKTAAGGSGRGPREDWNETVIPVGKGAEGFDISPDGREVVLERVQERSDVVLVDLARR